MNLTDQIGSQMGVNLGVNTKKMTSKAKTILTPNLESASFGNMLIVFDNMEKSHSLTDSVTGKIKVNLREPFEARALTLNLCGFQRSHFKRTEIQENEEESKIT